jgi:pyridinium-3,5-bisthiocarboxylic acid mononucleotide nickel chelatase
MAHDHDHEHEHEHEHEHDHEHGHERDSGHGHGRGEEAWEFSGEELARGAGAGKVLFLDAFSGIAGDMLVAALVDLGVPQAVIRVALEGLPVRGYQLRFVRRVRSGIAACGFVVDVREAQPARDYAAIRALLHAAAGLSEGARRLALHAFQLLAAAEARVHGTSVERVQFHEVGAVDSIVDVVAAAVALDYLGAEVVCSALPIGRGLIRAAHGPLPGPAPATLLCLEGVPTHDAGIDVELVTPTGACLVRAAALRFARWPSMRPLRSGWGAGTRTLPDRPNALRVVLGEPTSALGLEPGTASHVVLEANVDDMTGELAASALARAHEAGALDAWSTPIGMKKGRPALMLSALARRGDSEAVARALLSESTSLGLRVRDVGRIERARRMVEVQTAYGPIALKVADGDGLPPNVAPEFDHCQAAAQRTSVPVKQVYAAAIAAYFAQPGPPGTREQPGPPGTREQEPER